MKYFISTIRYTEAARASTSWRGGGGGGTISEGHIVCNYTKKIAPFMNMQSRHEILEKYYF